MLVREEPSLALDLPTRIFGPNNNGWCSHVQGTIYINIYAPLYPDSLRAGRRLSWETLAWTMKVFASSGAEGLPSEPKDRLARTVCSAKRDQASEKGTHPGT